jgi:SAM-dependent methyltransferase
MGGLMRRHRSAAVMRRYWDDRARENAVYYVDTTCDYDHPDLSRFFETGRDIVTAALVEAPLRPPGRALAVEFGSGLGRNCVALADHFDRVIGVDISAEMVRRARDLVDSSAVRFEVTDGEDVGPVETASADFVLSFTVLQHMHSLNLVTASLGHIAEVLRPGGVAALQWNNLPNARLWRLRAMTQRIGRRLGVRRWRDVRYSAPFLGRPVPWPEMSRALRGAGLEPRATAGLGTLFAWVWAERV